MNALLTFTYLSLGIHINIGKYMYIHIHDMYMYVAVHPHVFFDEETWKYFLEYLMTEHYFSCFISHCRVRIWEANTELFSTSLAFSRTEI